MVCLLKVTKHQYQEYKRKRFAILDYHKTGKIETDFRLLPIDIYKANSIKNTTGHYYCFIYLDDLMKQVNSNEIIGLVCYKHKGNFSKLLEIEIFDEYKRRGFANNILKKIMSEAKMHHSEYLSLFVFNHRIAAIRLYEKNNFVNLKEFEKGRTMIVQLMDKILEV